VRERREWIIIKDLSQILADSEAQLRISVNWLIGYVVSSPCIVGDYVLYFIMYCSQHNSVQNSVFAIKYIVYSLY